jgi:hypothetical protein
MIAAILGTLLIIEGAFRIILGHAIVLFPRNHAEAHYGSYVLRRMTPNTTFWHTSVDGKWQFRINNKGFRDDKNYEYDKPAGTLRVMVLGDSHTAGFEVDQDEIFATVLERALRQQGVPSEVLNTGISGFGTAEELAYLENEGLRYAPDVVIVAFFANDFSDNLRANLYRLMDGQLVAESTRYAPAVDILKVTLAIPGLKWLGENSYAYSYIFNTVWQIAKVKSIQRAEATSVGPENAVPVGMVNATEEALAEALLRRIGQIGRRHGIYTVLVDIPFREGPNDTRTSFTSGVRDAGSSTFDRVLGSDEYLSGRPNTQPAHVPNGHHHINAYTHRRLGESLARILTTEYQHLSHSDVPNQAQRAR